MNPSDIVAYVDAFTREHRGEVAHQQFFQLLRRFALEGMGVGMGDAMSISGEAMSIARVGARLASTHGADTWNIFDVGANVGDFLAVCRDMLGEERRRYFCFEPSTAAFAALSARVADMQGVQAINMALADKPGEMQLFSDKPGSGLGSLSHRRLDHMGIEMVAREKVKVSTLDAFTEE